MDRKKKIVLCLTQFCILAFFVVLALGSASSKGGSNVDYSSFLKGAAEGFACGANGFILVGQTSSESSCKSLCAREDYSAYCFTRTENACFCK